MNFKQLKKKSEKFGYTLENIKLDEDRKYWISDKNGEHIKVFKVLKQVEDFYKRKEEEIKEEGK